MFIPKVQEESPGSLPGEVDVASEFLQISSPDELAAFLGHTYEDLAEIIYGISAPLKYSQFEIPKKSGGYRSIKSPCRRLKLVQQALRRALDDVYKPKASTHGFVGKRSVVTNARSHLKKRFVFNIDLLDYFGSVHFGRVKYLFRSQPFNFDSNVATILAHICCFENALPQGAPTSPVVANMITRKLDRQLEDLARKWKATYTRYADDISFSFTCPRRRLPVAIVNVAGDLPEPGRRVVHLIETNGFRINPDKVRLVGRAGRMEVTGIIVNDFTNLPRRYVRQIGSMLYAWETFGYEAARGGRVRLDS